MKLIGVGNLWMLTRDDQSDFQDFDHTAAK